MVYSLFLNFLKLKNKGYTKSIKQSILIGTLLYFIFFYFYYFKLLSFILIWDLLYFIYNIIETCLDINIYKYLENIELISENKQVIKTDNKHKNKEKPIKGLPLNKIKLNTNLFFEKLKNKNIFYKSNYIIDTLGWTEPLAHTCKNIGI